ncbi:MAG: hypothetical protein ACRDYY_08315 [Acidimicrobiales bacterium]
MAATSTAGYEAPARAEAGGWDLAALGARARASTAAVTPTFTAALMRASRQPRCPPHLLGGSRSVACVPGRTCRHLIPSVLVAHQPLL